MNERYIATYREFIDPIFGLPTRETLIVPIHTWINETLWRFLVERRPTSSDLSNTPPPIEGWIQVESRKPSFGLPASVRINLGNVEVRSYAGFHVRLAMQLEEELKHVLYNEFQTHPDYPGFPKMRRRTKLKIEWNKDGF